MSNIVETVIASLVKWFFVIVLSCVLYIAFLLLVGSGMCAFFSLFSSLEMAGMATGAALVSFVVVEMCRKAINNLTRKNEDSPEKEVANTHAEGGDVR